MPRPKFAPVTISSRLTARLIAWRSARIVERRLGDVQAEIGRLQLVVLDDGHSSGLVQALDVPWRDVLHQVDVASLELGQPCVVLGDDANLDAVDVRRSRVLEHRRAPGVGVVAARTSFWLRVHDTNLNGPVPSAALTP